MKREHGCERAIDPGATRSFGPSVGGAEHELDVPARTLDSDDGLQERLRYQRSKIGHPIWTPPTNRRTDYRTTVGTMRILSWNWMPRSIVRNTSYTPLAIWRKAIAVVQTGPAHGP